MSWTALIALAGAMLLAAPARAADRALGAILEGDPELVAAVGGDLTRRGVAVAAPDDPEAVRVSLARAPEGIRLELRDGQGRAAERQVATTETAAALIESWARPDIAGPLLDREAPPPPAPAAPSIQPPPILADTVTVSPVRPTPPPPPPPAWNLALRLGGDAGTGDRSPWLGASVGACRRVGPLCLGGEARLAHQLRREHDFDGPWPPPQDEEETDLRALFLAELPISLGRPVLVLGLGAGVGLRSAGDAAKLGVRQEVRATLALPLWSKLAAEVGLTAGMGPRARDPFRPEEGWVPGAQVRLGLGLRWGVP